MRIYNTGCGNYVAKECLTWADNYYSLDDWQDWYLTEGLGTGPNQRFTATDVCGIIPRQNGKGTCLEVRELAGLFVLKEKRIIHTAHQFSTAVLHFDRIMEVFDANPELSKWLAKNPARAHGFEAIELKPEPTLIFAANSKMVRESFSRKLEFHARTSKKSRGFTSNCLVIDEAMYLTGEQVGAIRPTLRAVANHQVWLMGSAGMKDSLELASYHEDIIDDTQDSSALSGAGSSCTTPRAPVTRCAVASPTITLLTALSTLTVTAWKPGQGLTPRTASGSRKIPSARRCPRSRTSPKGTANS